MKEKISRRNFISGSIVGVGAMSVKLKGKSGDLTTSDILSNELPKRRLGRTNAMVSCIGFGGGSRYAGADEKVAEKLIDYAIKLGITYFDAARSYGGGKTEKRYGRYLTPNYRDKIFLNSKSKMRDYDGVMKEIEISLKALRTDYLDLYCMHGIDEVKDVDALLSSSGGYKAFLKLKDEGIVKGIGMSIHYWNDAAKKAIKSFDIDAVLCPINASRNSGCEKYLLPIAKKRDISIIAIKTTGQNALIGNVTGGDLVRYVLSLPIAVANIGIEGLGTLESCAEIGRESVLSRKKAEKIHKKLAFDPKVIKLPYRQK